jgi:GNAT superfamily N-acetyltransferase
MTHPDIAIRLARPGDSYWITERHATLYAQAEGFDATFGPLVASILANFWADHDPARDCGWIAQRDDRRLGSIFCVTEDRADPAIAKLRLFLLEPEARGTGLAQAMLDTCLGFARGAGYRHMRLWTHESHRAAGRLYARNGFVLTRSQPVRSFGQNLVEQAWERAL